MSNEHLGAIRKLAVQLGQHARGYTDAYPSPLVREIGEHAEALAAEQCQYISVEFDNGLVVEADAATVRDLYARIDHLDADLAAERARVAGLRSAYLALEKDVVEGEFLTSLLRRQLGVTPDMIGDLSDEEAAL